MIKKNLDTGVLQEFEDKWLGSDYCIDMTYCIQYPHFGKKKSP